MEALAFKVSYRDFHQSKVSILTKKTRIIGHGKKNAFRKAVGKKPVGQEVLFRILIKLETILNPIPPLRC